MATACAKPPPNGQGLTPVRRHDPLAAVDVSALSGIIGMLSAINRNTVRLRSEQVSAFVGIRISYPSDVKVGAIYRSCWEISLLGHPTAGLAFYARFSV